MKHFYKHIEMPTVKAGLFLKIEATPQDARKNDVANTFYIGYLINRNQCETSVWRSELRTFSRKEVCDLLGVEKKERMNWD